MKKAGYKLILIAVLSVSVLSSCSGATPSIQSTADKDNHQLQLVKEQLRGDFYKDSQDNLKSALYTLFAITIAVILSAFGMIAYFIFKDKKDYKDAVDTCPRLFHGGRQEAFRSCCQ